MSGGIHAVIGRPRLDWLAATGAAIGVGVGGATLVSGVGTPADGARWLLVAGSIMLAELAFLGYHLARSDHDGTAAIGIPNAVTLVRGLLYAAVGGFLLVPPSVDLVAWAPGILYGTGAALDAVDGYLARRTGRTGELGERLDQGFDTLGFLVAPLVGVAWGRLPAFYLALSAARYVFRGGEAWRRVRGRPVGPLPESRPRRWLAAFQMVFIATALVPVFPASAVHIAAAVALAPSLALFARDWLAVSGRLPRREE